MTNSTRIDTKKQERFSAANPVVQLTTGNETPQGGKNKQAIPRVKRRAHLTLRLRIISSNAREAKKNKKKGEKTMRRIGVGEEVKGETGEDLRDAWRSPKPVAEPKRRKGTKQEEKRGNP